jgi:hypothetical protein
MAMKWSWSRVTEEEYRANLTGMNTFFGAVLGFVLSGVETPNLRDFAQLLFMVAGLVISILYVSASAQRWLYAVMTLLLIGALPHILDDVRGELGRLQVTLAVWLGMTVLLEALWAVQQRRDAKSIEPAA